MKLTVQPRYLDLPKTDEAARKAIRGLLFGDIQPRMEGRKVVAGRDGGPVPTYVMIEAARYPHTRATLEGFDIPHASLYQGEAADTWALHAPYIALAEPDTPFADWLIDESWTTNWGVYLRSRRTLEELRSQFRRFLRVHAPHLDRWYMFRFYAPETIRRSIAALPPEDFARFSQGVQSFIVSADDGGRAVVI